MVYQGARVWGRPTLRHFFFKSVLVKHVRLHISENFHLLLKYTPLDAVSMCRQNILFQKLILCLGV